MPKTALILLADRCEETEAVTVFDLLVRANINVTTTSITQKKQITCSRGIKLITDTTLSDIFTQSFDVIILPGGVKGAENFRDTEPVIQLIKQAHQQGSIIAGICATPAIVFAHHNLFPKTKMTGYPSTESMFPAQNWVNERVYYAKSQRVLTSQGPATSLDFGLEIINQLLGQAYAHEVARQLLLPEGINDYK